MCIVIACLLAIGYFHVASTTAVNVMAQGRGGGGGGAGAAAAVATEQGERGYYLPTRIIVEYYDADAITEAGVPEWLAKAVNVIRELYHVYDKYLESPGHVPSGVITLRAQSTGPIGWNSATTIGFNTNYIKPGAAGQEDWGMIAHELVHFIQGYPGGAGTGVPMWITEGIGDFVRHAMFEPERPMRAIGRNARYQDAYQVSAGFLMWIAENYNLNIVPLLNVHGRQRTYSPDVFVTYTGKELNELWAEYRETVIIPLANENRRMIPAQMFPKLMAHLAEFKAYVNSLEPEPRPAQGQPPRRSGVAPVNLFVPAPGTAVVTCTLGCNARPCSCVITPQHHALVLTFNGPRVMIGGLPYTSGTAFVAGMGMVGIAYPTSHEAGEGLLGTSGMNLGQFVRIGNLVENAGTALPLYRVARGGTGNDGLIANQTMQAIRREASWVNGTIPAAVTWLYGPNAQNVTDAGRANTVIGLVTAYNDGTFTIANPLGGANAAVTYTVPGNKDAIIWNFPSPRGGQGGGGTPNANPVPNRYRLNAAEIRAINNARVNPSSDPYSVYALVVHAPGNVNELLSVTFIVDHVVRADANE